MNSDILPSVESPNQSPLTEDLLQDAAALQQVRELLSGQQQAQALTLAREIQQDLAATRRELRSELAALSQQVAGQVQHLAESLQHEAQSRQAAVNNNSATLQNTIELMSKSLGEIEGRVGTRIETAEQRSLKALRHLDADVHARIESLESNTKDALRELSSNKVDARTLTGFFQAFQGQHSGAEPAAELPGETGA